MSKHFLEHVGTFGAAWVTILFPSMQQTFVELRPDLAPSKKKPLVYVLFDSEDSHLQSPEAHMAR
jgi:hypothetical protein